MTTPFKLSQDQLAQMNQEALVAIFLSLQKYAEDQEAEIQALRGGGGVHQEARGYVGGSIVGGHQTTVGDISNSNNLAIGPEASVKVSQVLRDDQREEMQKSLAQMRADIATLKDASEAQRLEAERRIAELEQAFTAEDQEVNADTSDKVKEALEWLIQNLPGLAGSVRALVESQPIQRLIQVVASIQWSAWIQHLLPG